MRGIDGAREMEKGVRQWREIEGKGTEVETERRKRGFEINREEVTTTERKALRDGGGDPCLSIFDYL